MMEEEIFCPLNKKCREIKDNKIHRCMWLLDIKGINPQTGEDEDKEQCAIAFTPIAILENAKHTRAVQRSTEEMRNKSDLLNNILVSAMETREKLQ